MKKTPIKLIVGTSIVLLCCFVMSCQRGKSTLKYEPPSQSPLANIYPNTPAGQRVKEHVQAAMGNGENAEAAYQESLTKLRAEPGAAEALIETYRKVPKAYYMLRTMLTEGLKELRVTCRAAAVGGDCQRENST